MTVILFAVFPISLYTKLFFLVGNRHPQGRRGSGPRVNKPRTVGGPVKFEGEFDFESSNAKFNKEEIEEELQQKLYENLRLKDEVMSYTYLHLPVGIN